MLFTAIWMDLEIIILSEVNQAEKHKYDITYMCNKKKSDTNELIYKTNRPTDIENKLMVTKGERGWRRDKIGVGD